MEIEKQLRDLDKEQQRIEERRSRLLQAQRELEERRNGLIKLVNESGYSSPKEFVQAVIEVFNITVDGKAAGKKRTRTTVTPQLRDAVKGDLASGAKRTAIAEKHGISYAVVLKIASGGYDQLS